MMKFLHLILLSAAWAPFALAKSSYSPRFSIVYKTRDSVPGGSTNDHFATFGNPAFNDYNNVAFQATVSEVTQFPIVYAMARSTPITASASAVQATNIPLPLFTNTWSGIWAQDQSGNLQLVVRSAPPMIADVGGFSDFSDPVYNNSNNVAFTAYYSPGFIYIPSPPLGSTNNMNVFRGGEGVWTSSTLTNPLQPVAYVGEPAPGCTTSNTFQAFDQIALPDQGGVIMLATLSNGQKGIWAQDTSGNLRLIARQGGTLKVGGKKKTIESISFLNATNPISGQTRNFSQDTGNLFFSATFTDGTQAGVKVIFP